MKVKAFADKKTKTKTKPTESPSKRVSIPFRERGAVGREEVAEWLGVGLTTLQALRARGRFPPPDLAIARRALWKVATVEQWLENQRGR